MTLFDPFETDDEGRSWWITSITTRCGDVAVPYKIHQISFMTLEMMQKNVKSYNDCSTLRSQRQPPHGRASSAAIHLMAAHPASALTAILAQPGHTAYISEREGSQVPQRLAYAEVNAALEFVRQNSIEDDDDPADDED